MDAKTRKRIYMDLTVASDSEVLGTSYAGVIRCKYDVIFKAFGTANFIGTTDNKVTCEWDLSYRTEEGQWIVFTIYNWKDETPPQANEMWHVGSHHKNDESIFAFLKKALRCDVIAR